MFQSSASETRRAGQSFYVSYFVILSSFITCDTPVSKIMINNTTVIYSVLFLSFISIFTYIKFHKNELNAQFFLDQIDQEKPYKICKIQAVEPLPKAKSKHKKVKKTKKPKKENKECIQPDRISYKPVSLARPDKGWLIIGFVDRLYLKPSLIWAKQLQLLGYDNYKIIAMDNDSYKDLQIKEKRGEILPKNYMKSKPYIIEHYFENRSKSYGQDYSRKIHSIWKIRVNTTYELLNEGYSLWIVDIDSVWNKFVDFETLPKNFDTFHAIASGFPDIVKKKWGFTICAGTAGYRPTEATIKLFSDIVETCESNCDDQVVLNSVMSSTWRMKWKNVTEKQKQAYPNFSMNYFKIGHSGLDKKDKFILQSMVISEKDILRFGKVTDCESTWIINPKSQKTGDSKVMQFQRFSRCLKIGNHTLYRLKSLQRMNLVVKNKFL